MEIRDCLKCGSDVELNGVGRPKVYCGPACRRAAEYELRRLQRALEAAERAVYKAEEDLVLGWPPRAQSEKRLAFAKEHHAALEARLRALLADDEVKVVAT